MAKKSFWKAWKSDVRVTVAPNGSVTASHDEGGKVAVSVLTYWHQPEDGSPGYVVVEIEDPSEAGPDGDEPSTPVRVYHNEGVVYDWKVPVRTQVEAPEIPANTRAHLVTFLVNVPEDLEDVDWDDVREQVGTGSADIHNDESIDPSWLAPASRTETLYMGPQEGS